MADEETPRDPFAPPEKKGIDRRTFVKTAMGAAALGAVSTATAGLVVPLSTSGGLNIRRFPYLGAKKIAGPAPQGIPLVPLTVNAEGYVEGVPLVELGPDNQDQFRGLAAEKVGPMPAEGQPDNRPSMINFLEWYKYCGHDKSPAFKPAFTDDNVLRYFNNPGKVTTAEEELGKRLWYAGKLNQRVHVDDFRDLPVDEGAPFRWRSEELLGNDIVTGIIIKVDPEAMGGAAEEVKAFMASSTDPANPEAPKDLVAFCSYCAHFCCVPGYKESKIPRDKKYRGQNLFNKIYCTCHDSVYDPRNIKQYTFPPNM